MYIMSSRKWAQSGARRCFATMKIYRNKPGFAESIIPNLPVYDADDTPPPEREGVVKAKWERFLADRKPVTSAHAIDAVKGEISTLDSAAISPSGSVVHGRYGELGPVADAIPLEYLALLRFAAEGAAGLRALGATSSAPTKGTVLIYGASQANGLAAAQIASAGGHAVVGVVGGEHSGNTIFMECVKGLISDPGTAVPDVYALSKKNFQDLVSSISSGDEGIETPTAEEYVEGMSVLKGRLLLSLAPHLSRASHYLRL